MRAEEFITESESTAWIAKVEATGKIIRIIRKQHSVLFSDKKDWLLVDVDPALGNKGLGIKWIPASTRFEWVRPYKEKIDVLDEGATAVLYHYAGITSARDILRDGVFKLSSTTGNPSEAGYAPRGYQYFLSTTRSRVGDYHRYVGSGAAMFVLDGNWLGQRYPVKPIDYWERSWQHSPGRTRESEDRVFSKDNTIPIDGVRALHVLMKEQSEVRSPATREMLILAKQQGIPAHLYMDETAWRLQDTRRAVSIKQAADVLKGPKPSPRSYRSRNFLEEILEMIFKKNKAELTTGARKRVQNLLIYGSRHPTEDDGLGVDMSNARKPGSSDYDSAVKINQFMRANDLKNTVELKNYLLQKWEATDFFKEDISKDKVVNEFSQTDPGIFPVMREKGYRLLGAGVDQSAWLEPESGLILKIFGTRAGSKNEFTKDHKMFFEWYTFCSQNKSNPFLPDFFGHDSFNFKNKRYLQIRTERLFALPTWLGEALEELARFAQFRSYNFYIEHKFSKHITDRDSKLLAQLGEENLKKLFETVQQVIKYGKRHNYKIDLHGGNFMLGSDSQIVINDPWVIF